MARLTCGIVIALALAGSAQARTDAVPVSRAGDHVGQETTIEGRIIATHASPLATVLAFAPNFAGFTATILAADRPKFTANFEDRYRDKLVRVTGKVTAYRGKPEMTLHEPSQLEVVPAPGDTPLPPGVPPPEPSPVATPVPTPGLETARALAALEERVGVLEARLAGIEQAVAELARANARSREPALAVGATGSVVRQLLGNPSSIVDTTDGGSIWQYGPARSVTFDRDGRVATWIGF